MAKNISLLGANYPDVPAVQLPQTGGGTATFYDINVVDNLNSDSSTDALSAKQGKVLNDKIGNFKVSKTDKSGGVTITCETAHMYNIIATSNDSNIYGNIIVQGGNSSAYAYTIAKGSDLTVSTSGMDVTLSCNITKRLHVMIMDYDYTNNA